MCGQINSVNCASSSTWPSLKTESGDYIPPFLRRCRPGHVVKTRGSACTADPAGLLRSERRCRARTSVGDRRCRVACAVCFSVSRSICRADVVSVLLTSCHLVLAAFECRGWQPLRVFDTPHPSRPRPPAEINCPFHDQKEEEKKGQTSSHHWSQLTPCFGFPVG